MESIVASSSAVCENNVMYSNMSEPVGGSATFKKQGGGACFSFTFLH
jgi:hypothetical protein